MLRNSSFAKIFRRNSILLSAAISAIASVDANAKEATSSKVVELPKVIVEATESKDGEVDGYKTGTTRSSTRTETLLLDVPQSISVVTQDQIRDQNVSSIGEAIRYVPGVQLHQGENNRDQVIIRGNSSSADFFVDGARDDVQYFRDLYNIDRVEVLKGPNAMAFGRGGSGGLVNRVLKFADGKRTRQVILSGGSFDNRRLQADVGDKINDKVSLRINTMYEKSGTFRQFGDLERYGFNPNATFNLGKNTNLKVGYEYFHDSRFNDRGIPSQDGVAFKTNPASFFGNPDLNQSDATINSGYTILSHEFNSTLKLRNYTRYTDNDKFYQNVYAGSAVNSSGNLTLSAYNNAIKRQNFTNQTDLTKKFSIGSVDHTALVGMEIARQNSKAYRNTGYFNNSSTSLTVSSSSPISYTPVAFRQSSTDADNHSEVDIYAGYAQDQIELTKKLQLTAGLRYEVFKMTFHDNRTGANFGQTNGMVSPRAGVVYKPEENVSLYGSYSVSYLPSSGDQFSTLAANTQGLRPEHLQNREVGVKWDVNPRLNVTAALYQLDRTNTRATDPNNSTLFVLTGATRTRGFELGTTGKITNKWQVIGGYAYQNAEIAKTTSSAAAGQKVALVPHNVGSLWNKYDFTREWAGAIGVISQSHQFASVDNTVKLKGFTRFDGAAYYKINTDYRLQLNVENLFGRRYIATADGNNNLQPGSPRAFKLSLIANF
ncbi:MAG: TonB-dependent siderophore receptor [Rickettsiales bacterium]|nr:TonB-dependent siderophore receptor [Rickettsiales bacterium]